MYLEVTAITSLKLTCFWWQTPRRRVSGELGKLFVKCSTPKIAVFPFSRTNSSPLKIGLVTLSQKRKGSSPPSHDCSRAMLVLESVPCSKPPFSVSMTLWRQTIQQVLLIEEAWGQLISTCRYCRGFIGLQRFTDCWYGKYNFVLTNCWYKFRWSPVQQ